MPDACSGWLGGAGLGVGEGAGRGAGDALVERPNEAVELAQRADASAFLSGRLLLGATPLADAVVVLCEGHHWQPVERARVRTDASGRFDLPAPRARYWITCLDERAPRSWSTQVASPPAKPRDLGDLAVPLPGSIVGRVVEAGGSMVAVAGAEVELQVSSYVHVALDGAKRPTATTDAEGRFSFDRVLPTDSLAVTCRSPRHAVQAHHYVEVKAAEVVETVVELRPGALLRGFVFDWRGQPLAGAAVTTEYGRRAETDALGRFVFEYFTPGADVTATASGHIEADADNVFDLRQPLQLRLKRAVTLTGVVHGAEGLSGVVRLEPDYDADDQGDDHRPFSLRDEDLDVLRDGRFEVRGLSCSAWKLQVRVPGVGAVGPVAVRLRDDRQVELTLVPEHQVEVVVRDERGAPVVGEVVVDDAAARSSYGYRDAARRLRAILASKLRRPPAALVDGVVRFGHPVGAAVALAVQAEGYATQALWFEGDAVPDRVDVVMVATGGLRGVVRGGDRAAYAASVRYWRADLEPLTPEARTAPIAADGTFSADEVLPGDYRAAVQRYGTTRLREAVRGVPLFDGGVDLRAVVDFRVVAGEVAVVELDEPPLGVLRGRVLLRGRPVAGVPVVAARPKRPGDRKDPFDDEDWDHQLKFQWADGAPSDAAGGFRMYYRDAGVVELRARHPDGHATSAPLVLDLPPPGDDVVRDLHLPSGELRGRFPPERIEERQRKFWSVTLFPLRKAARDPFVDPGDWASSIATDCASYEAPADGAFAFRHLPDGVYVVRVSRGVMVSSPCLWQAVVEVHGDVVDLGAIEPGPVVDAPLRWRWREGAVVPEDATIGGFWLTQQRHGHEVWCATVGVHDGAAVASGLPPGRYRAVPFQAWGGLFRMSGLDGQAIGDGEAFEIRPDGSIVPTLLTFSPLPAGGR